MRILQKALKTYKELKEKCFGYISDELEEDVKKLD